MVTAGVAAEVTARVRVDSWAGGDMARAGVSLGNDAAGRGYNLVFHADTGTVQFLHDHVAWGDRYSFDWQVGTWYRFKLRQEADGTLLGKVWADGSAEPTGWMFEQRGWAARAGSAGLNGGADGATTASFDDFAVFAAPTILFADNFDPNSLGMGMSGWTKVGGSWSRSARVAELRQTDTGAGDPKKALASGVATPAAAEVTARVRVDSWAGGDMARAGVSLGNDAAGRGYNLVFHADTGTVQFLHDDVAWGDRYSFDWQVGTWYWFKLRQEADGTLRGKVWADGSAEPTGWMFEQRGWAARAGSAGLNGGAMRHRQLRRLLHYRDLALQQASPQFN